ncbi:metallophosphoesterase [Microbacterium esteraromaticum]|uniref:metallophosphoesterase family protein n=1 Tax=Microbacterium esteraromaticum TaxID=57043 RepID=UPI002368BF24|nr:metallophosphoesterase [Microbacterium esteraromaticum]WDH79683.1 metallophosphoesterase [Microbacterium esteraromaticum]
MNRRRSRTSTVALGALLCATLAVPLASAAHAVEDPTTDPVGDLALLSDPFLQLPTADGVRVVWTTEYAGDGNVVLVGDGVSSLTVEQARAAAAGATFSGVTAYAAESSRFSRLAEDASSRLPQDLLPSAEDGIAAREVWRHEAAVAGLAAGERVDYRVVSTDGDGTVVSGTFSLAPSPQAGDDLRVLITSDHQAMANTPANLQMAAETIGDIDAVFLAGDLVNHPDRASEWFDDTRGSAFFAALQGNGGRIDNNGVQQYSGGEIVQNAVLFPAVGNHEVQGRVDGKTKIGASFGAPVPVEIAEAEYEKVAADVNPTADPDVKAQWIENNSFSTTSYEEMFTLPDDSPGGETYYAVTFGDIRLVSLYSTRIWRGTAAQADAQERTSTSRYQEAAANLDAPLEQGYGEFVFESLEEGSEQYEWLEAELASDDFQDARFRVVMLHEGPQGLGDNVMPHFAEPTRIEETNAEGEVVGVRYEYEPDNNMLLNDLTPLLESAGVDLVHNGHSHLWNRFVSENGVNYLETSNTGNSYGAYHELSGRSRPLPPEPWDASNYLSQGNPGGLEAVVPNVAPFRTETGDPQPFVQSNDLAVFAMLDTAANEVVSYAYDVRTPETSPWVIDRFALGREAGEPVDPEPTPEPTDPTDPTEPGDGGELAVTTSVLSVAAGGEVTISASGLAAGEAATIELHSDPVVLATAVADASGELSATVTIPATTEPGTHEIVLVAASGESAGVEIVVVAADVASPGESGDLAATGSSLPVGLLLGGGVLLAVGGAVTFFALRRRGRTG